MSYWVNDEGIQMVTYSSLHVCTTGHSVSIVKISMQRTGWFRELIRMGFLNKQN